MYGHKELMTGVRTICELCPNPKEYALFDKRIFLVSVYDGDTISVSSYKVTFFDILSINAKQFGFSLIDEMGKNLYS